MNNLITNSHLLFVTKQRLTSHIQSCRLKDDCIRHMELKMNKSVQLDPSSTTCRFCSNTFFDVRNLHRHDKICKNKQIYKDSLSKELDSRSKPNYHARNITINYNNDNSTTNNNNTINWNDYKIMQNILDRIPPEQIQHLVRSGDLVQSLENLARHSYVHDDTVSYTNRSSNFAKVIQNNDIVTERVNSVVKMFTTPVITFVIFNIIIILKILILNISDSLSSQEKCLKQKVFSSQKNVIYDTSSAIE